MAGRVDGGAYPSDLTDAEYAVPAPHLPRPCCRGRPRLHPLRELFAWLGHARRLSNDYERLSATSEALVLAAMWRLMVRRLARSIEFNGLKRSTSAAASP